MRRWTFLIVGIIISIGFAGCQSSISAQKPADDPTFVQENLNGTTADQESYDSTISGESVPTTVQTGTAAVRRWQLFQGTVNPIDENSLVPIEVTELDSGGLLVFGTEYIHWTMPDNKWEIGVESGWRVRLDALTAKGKTSSGDIVLGSGGEPPVVICLYNSVSGDVQCLLRKDFSKTQVNSSDLNSFDFLASESNVQDRELQEYIWQLHTGNESHEIAGLVLDGYCLSYKLTLTYKECPALRYEINFDISDDGDLYIQNLCAGQTICVPFDWSAYAE